MRSWKLLLLPAATATLLASVYGVINVTCAPGDRFYGFIHERGFIQPLILAVTCLTVIVVFKRTLTLRRGKTDLEAATQKPDTPSDEILECLQTICTTRQNYGDAAALKHIQRMAEMREKRIRKSYSNISYLASGLPVLGLFGTMLGMSNALFAAFAGGSLGADSIQQFVSSLSTAMDTTVLAMTCAAPLFAAIWILERFDIELGEHFADYLRVRLGLDDHVDEDKIVSALRSELSSLTRAVADEARLSFESVLQESTQLYQERLFQMLTAAFEQERVRDSEVLQTAVTQMAMRLAGAIQTIAEQLETHNNRLARDITRQISQLEQALRQRTPEEVVIRYSHDRVANGNGELKRIGRVNGREVAHV